MILMIYINYTILILQLLFIHVHYIIVRQFQLTLTPVSNGGVLLYFIYTLFMSIVFPLPIIATISIQAKDELLSYGNYQMTSHCCSVTMDTLLQSYYGHIAAVLLWVKRNISCTDGPCRWTVRMLLINGILYCHNISQHTKC